MEAVPVKEATELGFGDLPAFAEAMTNKAPEFSTGDDLSVQYRTLSGDQVQLTLGVGAGPQASLGGSRISLEDYVV